MDEQSDSLYCRREEVSGWLVVEIVFRATDDDDDGERRTVVITATDNCKHTHTHTRIQLH